MDLPAPALSADTPPCFAETTTASGPPKPRRYRRWPAPLPEHRCYQALELYRNGANLDDIGRNFGVMPFTVRAAINWAIGCY